VEYDDGQGFFNIGSLTGFGVLSFAWLDFADCSHFLGCNLLLRHTWLHRCPQLTHDSSDQTGVVQRSRLALVAERADGRGQVLYFTSGRYRPHWRGGIFGTGSTP
jgi:hypothetical protein